MRRATCSNCAAFEALTGASMAIGLFPATKPTHWCLQHTDSQEK